MTNGNEPKKNHPATILIHEKGFSNMSWNVIFNKAIDRFKEGLPIEDLLETINATTTHSGLMDRLDEAGIEFGCGGEFNFLCPLVKGIDSDYLFDTIDVPNDFINPNDESMI